MGALLRANQYGKAETRIVRVDRSQRQHRVSDLNVSVALAGDLDQVHLTGDNAAVLPTDTQKNTVYAFARQYGIGPIEEFGLLLARHFVDTQPAIRRARVSIVEYPWSVLGEHSFARTGGEARTATVVYDGAAEWVVSGVRDLILMNTTGSEFKGYVRDRYTTLPEASDRILATAVEARWRHASADSPFAESYVEARRWLIDAFADTYSRSLQQTLFAMAQYVLSHRPELAEVRLALPNKHHFLVDLTPFGLDNPDQVYYAADRPYGLIEGTVVREGAPDEGLAWW